MRGIRTAKGTKETTTTNSSANIFPKSRKIRDKSRHPRTNTFIFLV